MLLLLLIAGLKALLCKGAALGIFLLSFWLKGRQLKFNSDEWDNFFLRLSDEVVEKYTIGVYLAAAVISSVISYAVIDLAGYRHALVIAVLLFAGGLVFTGYKWRTQGRKYLLGRYREIPATIMARKTD